MKPPFLSVVVPCYNEAKNLRRGVLDHINSYLQTKKFIWEVIISDDGSSDESRDIVKEEIKKFDKFYLLENKHSGKPGALLNGIKSALGTFILFTDMDQSTPISELDKLLPLNKKGVGAVIGSRGLLRENFPLYRRLGSIVFMAFRKLFILPEIDDTQCGFKLFRRSVVAKAFPHLQYFKRTKDAKGWSVSSYDVELLHLIKKMGYQIEEVHVEWKDEDKSESKGGTFSRYFKESTEMFVQILRVKRNDSLGMYDDIANETKSSL
jgi:dolichyl-phosphate beta-glucosyltransferase